MYWRRWYSELIKFFVIAMLCAYILAMTMPFVPGIEIGLAHTLLLGSDGLPLILRVYSGGAELPAGALHSCPGVHHTVLPARHGSRVQILQCIYSLQPAPDIQICLDVRSALT